jgi:hypothetical protein
MLKIVEYLSHYYFHKTRPKLSFILEFYKRDTGALMYSSDIVICDIGSKLAKWCKQRTLFKLEATCVWIILHTAGHRDFMCINVCVYIPTTLLIVK